MGDTLSVRDSVPPIKVFDLRNGVGKTKLGTISSFPLCLLLFLLSLGAGLREMSVEEGRWGAPGTHLDEEQIKEGLDGRYTEEICAKLLPEKPPKVPPTPV